MPIFAQFDPTARSRADDGFSPLFHERPPGIDITTHGLQRFFFISQVVSQGPTAPRIGRHHARNT